MRTYDPNGSQYNLSSVPVLFGVENKSHYIVEPNLGVDPVFIICGAKTFGAFFGH